MPNPIISLARFFVVPASTEKNEKARKWEKVSSRLTAPQPSAKIEINIEDHYLRKTNVGNVRSCRRLHFVILLDHPAPLPPASNSRVR